MLWLFCVCQNNCRLKILLLSNICQFWYVYNLYEYVNCKLMQILNQELNALGMYTWSRQHALQTKHEN